jgi:phosphotransferase system HPr-like phosphotransfer protein
MNDRYLNWGNPIRAQNSAYELLWPPLNPCYSPWNIAMKFSENNLSFLEKARLFSHDFIKCCLYIATCDLESAHFTKKLYSRLIGASQVLEDFLDFHGAKNSQSWYFYRELTAAIRHLSLGAYAQMHIQNRMVFYDLQGTEAFKQAGEQTTRFLVRSVIRLAPAIIQEAEKLQIQFPKTPFSKDDFPAITTQEILNYDIDDDSKDVQKKNIVKISGEFLRVAQSFDEFVFFEPYNLDEIRVLVPEKVNEVEIRRFEMLVHNLQSSFDTYVIHGGYRFGNRKLKQLRSYFSVVFHLLQMIGRLLHLYERHLYEAGYKHIYKKVQSRLSDLVDPDTLLDRTINYGLFFTCHFLTTGTDLAKEILNENIERGAIRVGIPVGLGFHMRPSLLVAKVVQYYGGEVELCLGEDRFDASSVLDIQWAGGKIQKENIAEVVFEGDVRALKDIEILAAANYGEDTMGKDLPLPGELRYLR